MSGEDPPGFSELALQDQGQQVIAVVEEWSEEASQLAQGVQVLVLQSEAISLACTLPSLKLPSIPKLHFKPNRPNQQAPAASIPVPPPSTQPHHHASSSPSGAQSDTDEDEGSLDLGPITCGSKVRFSFDLDDDDEVLELLSSPEVLGWQVEWTQVLEAYTALCPSRHGYVCVQHLADYLAAAGQPHSPGSTSARSMAGEGEDHLVAVGEPLEAEEESSGQQAASEATASDVAAGTSTAASQVAAGQATAGQVTASRAAVVSEAAASQLAASRAAAVRQVASGCWASDVHQLGPEQHCTMLQGWQGALGGATEQGNTTITTEVHQVPMIALHQTAAALVELVGPDMWNLGASRVSRSYRPPPNLGHHSGRASDDSWAAASTAAPAVTTVHGFEFEFQQPDDDSQEGAADGLPAPEPCSSPTSGGHHTSIDLLPDEGSLGDVGGPEASTPPNPRVTDGSAPDDRNDDQRRRQGGDDVQRGSVSAAVGSIEAGGHGKGAAGAVDAGRDTKGGSAFDSSDADVVAAVPDRDVGSAQQRAFVPRLRMSLVAPGGGGGAPRGAAAVLQAAAGTDAGGVGSAGGPRLVPELRMSLLALGAGPAGGLGTARALGSARLQQTGRLVTARATGGTGGAAGAGAGAGGGGMTARRASGGKETSRERDGVMRTSRRGIKAYNRCSRVYKTHELQDILEWLPDEDVDPYLLECGQVLEGDEEEVGTLFTSDEEDDEEDDEDEEEYEEDEGEEEMAGDFGYGHRRMTLQVEGPAHHQDRPRAPLSERAGVRRFFQPSSPTHPGEESDRHVTHPRPSTTTSRWSSFGGARGSHTTRAPRTDSAYGGPSSGGSDQAPVPLRWLPYGGPSGGGVPDQAMMAHRWLSPDEAPLLTGGEGCEGEGGSAHHQVMVQGYHEVMVQGCWLTLGTTLASTECSAVRLGELHLPQQAERPVRMVVKAYRPERLLEAVAEVVALERLHGWPGCVRLLGYSGTPSGGLQLFLQPCDCNMHQWAQQNRTQTDSWRGQALRMFLEVCRLVSALHSMHVAHCDLKPQNVLLLGGRPLLADLSEACSETCSDTRNATDGGAAEADLQLWEARGTEVYNSGEMHVASEQHPVDAMGADVWALGCILFETLTGELLFPGPMHNRRPLMQDPKSEGASWMSEVEVQLLSQWCGGEEAVAGAVQRLVEGMCRPQASRITAAQVVQHTQELVDLYANT